MRGRGPIQAGFQSNAPEMMQPQVSNLNPIMPEQTMPFNPNQRPAVSGQGLPIMPSNPIEGLTVEPQQRKRNPLLEGMH